MLRLTHKSILAVSLCLSFGILTGCANSKAPSLTSPSSTWMKLDHSVKQSLVNTELKHLGYTGSISVATLIDALDQKRLDTKKTIKEAVDNQLAQMISSDEKKKLVSLPFNNYRITELQSFTHGNSFDVLRRLKDKKDTQYFQHQLQSLTKVVNENIPSNELIAKIAAGPLQTDETYVKNNSAGVPEAYVTVQDTGNQPVVAFKVAIKCYDSAGNPVINPNNHTNVFYGSIKNITVEPQQGTGSDVYWRTYTANWTLTSQRKTKSIEVRITEAQYANGKVWSLN